MITEQARWTCLSPFLRRGKVACDMGRIRLTLPAAVLLLMLGCQEQENRWVPFGEEEAVFIHLSKSARQLLNQFPLVQILDEHLDLTSGIIWFTVRDKTGEEFDLFYRYWDERWMKRVYLEDGSYSFEDYQ